MIKLLFFRHCEEAQGRRSNLVFPPQKWADPSRILAEKSRLLRSLRSLAMTASSISLVPLFLLSGCGYTQKTVLPENIQSIHIDTVQNGIDPRELYAYVPGLEIKITDAIIDRLQRDGNLKVTTQDKADAILESKLVRFDQQGVRFSSLEDVEEYRLFITISMQLVSRKTGQIIWQESSFDGDSEYFVSQVRSLSREQAAERAVQNLAYNVVDRIVEDW